MLNRRFLTLLPVALLSGVLIAAFLATIHTVLQNFSHFNGYLFADGRPVGGDFYCFYAAGKLIAEQPSALYDPSAQFQQEQALFGEGGNKVPPLLFVYPPLVAWFFSILTTLSYLEAFALWTGISFLMGSLSTYYLSRELGWSLVGRVCAVAATLGYVPYTINNLAAGHLSSVGLAIVVAFFVLYQRGRFFLSGLVLSLTYYKPPIFLLLFLYFMVRGPWSLRVGFLTGAVTLLVGTLLVVPYDVAIQNIELLTQYRYGGQYSFGYELWPKHGAGLLALLTILFNREYTLVWPTFFGVAFLILTGIYRRLLGSRSHLPVEAQFSIALTLSLFLSLQMVAYDLTLCIPAILVVVTHAWSPACGIFLRGVSSMGLLCLFCEFALRQMEFNAPAIATPIAHTIWVACVIVVLGGLRRSQSQRAEV